MGAWVTGAAGSRGNSAHSRSSIFTKTEVHSDEAVQKYNWVHDIAINNNFRAPRARLLKPRGSTLVALDFIADYVPVRKLYSRYLLGLSLGEDILSVLNGLGRALGAIHSAKIPQGWVRQPIDPLIEADARHYGFQGKAEEVLVPLHGDFGQMNLGIETRGNQIVILDPCANFGAPVDHHLVYGEPELDISTFLGFLEGQMRSLASVVGTRSRICRAQAAFLNGYRSSGRTFNLERVLAYSYALFAVRMRRMGRASFLSTHLVYNRLHGNSNLQDKVTSIRRFLHAE